MVNFPPTRFQPGRRAGVLLLALTSLASAACGSGGAAPEAEAVSPRNEGVSNGATVPPSTLLTPLEEEPQAAIPDPISEANPMHASIYLEPGIARQGGVVLLAVDAENAGAASVVWEGRILSLIPGEGRFFTILPISADAALGPASLTVAVANATGVPVLQTPVEFQVEAVDWPTENLDLTPELARLLDPDMSDMDAAVRDAVVRGKSPQRLWEDVFQPPTAGPPTSLFGVRRSYNGVESVDFHTGLDFGGSLGDAVVAAADGIVAWVGETERRGRGVMLDHGGGVFTSYWHLSTVDARDGATVLRGERIGRVGVTGLSTGPHLHWEVVVHGVPVDPLPWLRDLEIPDPAAVFDEARAVYRSLDPETDQETGPAVGE